MILKVLLVDDEKHVRSSIKMLVDWNRYTISEILEADNGASAIEVIQEEKPDIIITDMMMPIKSGSQLLQWIGENHDTCQNIVISGFNDFELVRSVVRQGSIDYILKPIDKDQLESALEKAIHILNKMKLEFKKEIEQNIKVKELNSVYVRSLLSKLLLVNENEQKTVLKNVALKYPEVQEIKTSHVAILNLELLDKNIQLYFKESNDLLVFSIINICNDLLQPMTAGLAFQNMNSPNEIILLMWMNTNKIHKKVAEIERTLARIFKGRFDIGIGAEVPFPIKLNESYQQSQLSLDQVNLLDRSNRIHFHSPAIHVKLNSLRFEDYEKNIYFGIKSGNSSIIKTNIQEWFLSIRQLPTITLNQLKTWKSEYIIMRSRWIESLIQDTQYNQKLIFRDLNLNELLDDSGLLDFAILQDMISNDLINLSQCYLESLNKDIDIIEVIAQYIQDNYHQKITLQKISEKFSYNHEYISRKFSSTFNETLIGYLNRIRIEKSKILLENPQLKIYEVANMVGFPDDKYFSRVFKRAEGQSPAKYRETI